MEGKITQMGVTAEKGSVEELTVGLDYEDEACVFRWRDSKVDFP